MTAVGRAVTAGDGVDKCKKQVLPLRGRMTNLWGALRRGMTNLLVWPAPRDADHTRCQACVLAGCPWDWPDCSCMAGARPSCSIIDIRFQCAHSSTILPPSSR
jgi:hypothetical protein